MTPGARVQAAAEILDHFAETAAPVDGLLAAWARASRYAGSKDRAAVADHVHGALRRWRSLAAAGGAETGRARLLAALAEDGATLETADAVFSGARHAPAALSPQERARYQALLDADGAAGAGATPAERGDWPEWLWETLARSVADPVAELASLRRRRPLDFRVNGLRTRGAAAAFGDAAPADIARVQAALAADGVETAPGPVSPLCLRAARPAALARVSAYQSGVVEVQDAGSQAAALLAEAAPGETVLDICAGGGGKTLALAAAMALAADAPRDQGRLVAYDAAPARLKDLAPRLARAGARAEIARDGRDLRGLQGACDLVLVDAPCSGSGAWSRRADGRWRFTPQALAAAEAAQAAVLDAAARYVRPGGRLVYVTCSLFAQENTAQTAAFRARRPAFEQEPLGEAWRRVGLLGAPPSEPEIALTPAVSATDGFFISRLRRTRR